MKFQHLSIGQEFRYQDETYIKVSPMVANHTESGASRLIPRYAEILPCSRSGTPDSLAIKSTLEPSELQRAFDQFHNACQKSLDVLAGQVDDPVLSAIRDKISQASNDLFRKLSTGQ